MLPAKQRTIGTESDHRRPGAGDVAPDVIGYFGPQSVTWRIGRERVMLLGAGRAILMQLAHPLVAAGVAQHSHFMRDPVGRSTRTIEFTQVLAFGTRPEVHAMARTVNQLHASVQGKLGRPTGAYPAQAAYRARDPELLLWVYATLVDTALMLYPLLVRPLTTADQHRYYQESKTLARLLGVPEHALPNRLEDFTAYVCRMLSGSALAPTPEARMLAHGLLYLPAPAPLRAAEAFGEQLTIGLLPQPLRDLYGYAWEGRRERLLLGAMDSIRHLLPLVPAHFRYTPWSRRARARLS